MAPKKHSNVKSIHSMNSSTDSRNRMNMVNDLITKSQEALSSQATVYQQRTQSSQNTNLATDYDYNDDRQYNRQEIEQVFISRQQQEIIQKILQLARKGKVNSTNAFDIPIKVIHSQNTSSINNKFWKFSSQLLGASMNIYDKRVQNMYLSTNALQNKLMRVGVRIKQKDQNKMNNDLDNIQNDQQRRRMQQNRQRRQILSISLENFQGSLNLQDQNIIGIQTLQKKQKLDIKQIQHQFIADPTFLRTQKMFDSFSVKSLMLNIFSFSNNLDVRIFHKSDLEMEKFNQNIQKPIIRQNQMMIKRQNQMMNNVSNFNDYDNQQKQQYTQSIKTQTLSKNLSNDVQFGNSSLPYQYQKHLQIVKKIAYQNQMFKQITDFKIQQFQLVKDYSNRNPILYEQMQSQLKSNTKSQYSNSIFGSNRVSQDVEIDQHRSNQPTFKQIMQKQMDQFITLMKQIDHNFDQNMGRHNFYEGQNGQGLYQTHQTQSQQPYQHINNHDDNFQASSQNYPLSVNQANSVPISMQETSFFQWDQDHNIMQPIMPWQLQVRNLQLFKKAKKRSKNGIKKQRNVNNHSFKAQFDLQFLDRSKILLLSQAKQAFQKNLIANSRKKQRYVEKNITVKAFDYVCTQYHQQNNLNNRYSLRKSNFKTDNQQKQNKRNNSFALDIDPNQYEINKNPNKLELQDQQTRMNQPYYGEHQSSGIPIEQLSKFSHNTVYFGNMSGITNIRQIKQYIKILLNQKSSIDLQEIKPLLPKLSEQQIFTIFLHLTNQLQLIITNNQDDTNPKLEYPTRRENDMMVQRAPKRNLNKSIFENDFDIQI